MSCTEIEYYRLQTIIVYRFVLQIRLINRHPNYTGSILESSSSLGGFRVAIRRLDDSIIEEFGDPDSQEPPTPPHEDSQDHMEQSENSRIVSWIEDRTEDNL